jgi:chromosome segregation ATPase
MDPYTGVRTESARDTRSLLAAPGRAELASETDAMINRLRRAREELATARVELTDAIAASTWASQRYESAASKARTAASAWFRTRGRWEATSRALRRQFVDAVISAERLRQERVEVTTVAAMLRREVELIEHEMLGLTRQIGDLVDLEMKLDGQASTLPAFES